MSPFKPVRTFIQLKSASVKPAVSEGGDFKSFPDHRSLLVSFKLLFYHRLSKQNEFFTY